MSKLTFRGSQPHPTFGIFKRQLHSKALVHSLSGMLNGIRGLTRGNSAKIVAEVEVVPDMLSRLGRHYTGNKIISELGSSVSLFRRTSARASHKATITAQSVPTALAVSA